jgi:hypothetical protein
MKNTFQSVGEEDANTTSTNSSVVPSVQFVIHQHDHSHLRLAAVLCTPTLQTLLGRELVLVVLPFYLETPW